MKRISIVTLLFSLLSATGFAKSMMSNAYFMEAKDIQWEAVEQFPGLSRAVVEGDAAKGAHHAFMKFTAGFSAPLHHHTADTFATVVAGTLVLTVDGMEHRLTPGSFFSFKRKQPHATMCAAGAECIISVDARGKWDTIPEKKLVKTE